MFNMSTIRKTVTFTGQQDKWIKAQIEAGDYTNDSEYIRNLVRQDQINNIKFLSLKTKLIDGLESGVSTKSLPNIMKEVEARMQEDGRL
jgi:antitoxin ParD1/3/4